jgi:hypothetical protein
MHNWEVLAVRPVASLTSKTSQRISDFTWEIYAYTYMKAKYYNSFQKKDVNGLRILSDDGHL